MNRGAIDFLTKPIDFADFEITIRKGLAHIARLKNSIQTQEDLIALHHELAVAARIQRWTLPRIFPPFPERRDFELHAAMAPAKDVSGDLFDFFLLDETHLGFMIGDVNGTGVSAALYAAITRTLLRATALQGIAPAACLQRLESALAGQQDASMSPTLFYGVLDTRTGDLEFASNGHPAPYYHSANGGAKPLHIPAKQHTSHLTGTIRMKPGDGLLLYTDGVTEANNATSEWFGDDRIKEHVNLHASGTSEQMVLDLITALRFFSPATPQGDDITVMALRYRG
jgi:sigma-B regulation protein RsbU (phosphoserine phosphatase)